MHWTSIQNSGLKAVDAVTDSFAPARDVTARQIRKNGLMCFGIGLLCFAIGGAVLFTMPVYSTLPMLPMLMGYAFIIVGSYRAVMGKIPAPAHPGEMSLARIGFAVATLVAVFATFIGSIMILDPASI